MDILIMLAVAGVMMLCIKALIGYLRYPSQLKAWASRLGLTVHVAHPIRQLQTVRRLMQPLKILQLQAIWSRRFPIEPRVRDLISGELEGLALHLFRLNSGTQNAQALRDETVLLFGPMTSDWPNCSIVRNNLLRRPLMRDPSRVRIDVPGTHRRLYVSTASEHQAIRDWLQQGSRLQAFINMPRGMRIVLRQGHIAFIRRRRASLPSLKRFIRSALACTQLLQQ